VVGEELGVGIGTAEGLDPRCHETVLVDAASSWDLSVGDIPHEQVPESPFAFAGHGGAPDAPQKLLSLEGV
jgi:hypothetical protein